MRVIRAIADQVIAEDTSTGALAFTIGDVETDPDSLTVTAVSSNQTIIPDANLVLGGTGTDRTITVTPARAPSTLSAFAAPGLPLPSARRSWPP